MLRHCFAAAVGGGDVDEVSRGDGTSRGAEEEVHQEPLELHRGA